MIVSILAGILSNFIYDLIKRYISNHKWSNNSSGDRVSPNKLNYYEENFEIDDSLANKTDEEAT